LDIYIALAGLLGFEDQLTQGKTKDQWLQQLYNASNVPMTWEQFQQAGYYKFQFDYTTQVPVTVANQSFYNDPVKNPLGTPSGMIELYSQKIVDFFGTNNPSVPLVPQYVVPAEYSSMGGKYPLIM